MTAAAPATSQTLNDKQLGLLFQYTVEAYKTFEKLAESLPNPMTAMMFKQFAADERGNRDLLDMKNVAIGTGKIRATLGGDSYFQDMLEGRLSYREQAEFLILREKTMEKKLNEFLRSSGASDRNLLTYLIAVKRAHVVELERELELTKNDPDWFKREDAEWRIVHGSASV